MTTTNQVLRKSEKERLASDKQSEVAYVREEKKADEDAARRLAEQYGGGAKKVEGPGRRTRGWKCPDCHFTNYDIRSVCGECLAPNPSALTQAKPNIREDGVSQDPYSQVVKIAGRGYRTFASAAAPPKVKSNSTEEAAIPSYREEDEDDYDDAEDDVEEVDEDGFGVIQQDPVSKDYFMKLNIPSRYWKFIIGTRGAALQETQRLTGTTVVIPKEGTPEAKDEVVLIKAIDPSAIRAAQLRINSVVVSCKDKVEYTHFISIPLGSLASLQKQLASTLEEMAQTCCDEDKKIDPSIFQQPERLHLTLLMLRLHSSDELARAITLLTGLQKRLTAIFHPSDRVHLKKLNYMNDDPTEVHVVYLEIEENNTKAKLIQLINEINDTFIAEGLALEKDVAHNEKLHATMMNSKWRKSTAEGSAPRESFDATDVFRAFGNIDLGTHRLETMDLSILGGGNALYGYFPADATIEFPKC